MAGIDNNTVLYLKGDSFKDLSLNPKTVNNNGVTIIDNSVKYLNFNGNGNFLNVDKSVIYDYIINDFTIEFYVKSNTTSRQMILMLDDDVSGNGTQETISMNLMSNIINVTFRNTSNNLFKLSSSAVDFTSSVRHVALVRSENLLSIYIDGINVGKQTISGSLFVQNAPLAIGRYGNYNNVFFNGIINNLRISNIARYTKNFTPPTQPFNSINVNVTNKTFSQIDFNVTKLGQETINKVEVLQGNVVKETYTDNFDNLTFNHNNKNVKIVVTYDDVYTEELDVHIGNSKAKIYLYKEGNECESITGGWKDLLLRNQGGTITRTKEVDHLKVSTNITVAYPTNGGYVTSNTINFNKDVLSSELYYRYSLKRSTTNTTYYSNFALATYSDISTNNKEILTRYETYTTCEVGDNLIGNVDISNVQDVYVGFNAGHNNSTSETKVYEVYLETKENVISINSQDTSSINFSCNNLDNLITVTKAEVYINNKLSKTYENNFDNLTYNIDNSLCSIGKNNISIKATYTQGDDISETVEEILTHVVIVNNLPTTSSLKDVIDRQELLNNSIEIQKSNLKNILVSKNVEVEEENKLSNLIDKVNELGDNPEKLYLYKEGDDCASITGGYSVTWRDSRGNGSLTNIDNCLKLYYVDDSVSATAMSCGSNKQIDLTSYNNLHIEYESNGFGDLIFGVADNTNSTGVNVANISCKNATSFKTIGTVNISNINSSKYIKWYGWGKKSSKGSTMKVYKIWLEK